MTHKLFGGLIAIIVKKGDEPDTLVVLYDEKDSEGQPVTETLSFRFPDTLTDIDVAGGVAYFDDVSNPSTIADIRIEGKVYRPRVLIPPVIPDTSGTSVKRGCVHLDKHFYRYD